MANLSKEVETDCAAHSGNQRAACSIQQEIIALARQLCNNRMFSFDEKICAGGYATEAPLSKPISAGRCAPVDRAHDNAQLTPTARQAPEGDD
jgi:predicted amidophosphoribosyltransferase